MPSSDDLAAFHAGLAHLHRLRSAGLRSYFPDVGEYSRDKYQKHLEFFRRGKTHPQRLFMAANRVGKTLAGAFEVVCHLTGEYPDWWEGRRFTEPGEWWVCGKDWGTTRDIVQTALVGPVTTDGRLQGGGMLPFDRIIHYTRRPHGLPGSLDTLWVKHVSGAHATAQFKAYEQTRKSFEGTAKQGIWDDEEPPEDVYTEQLYRTATTKGITIVTFTPLQGMSNVVRGFIDPDNPDALKYKATINAGWDDVPHLGAEEKAALIATTPPFQRDARTKGIPQLGSGAVFGFPETELVIPDFDIPAHWVHCGGMDAGGGAKPTAGVWLAADPRVGGKVVLYRTYKRETPEIAVHLAAFKAPGDWIPFHGDAASLVVTEHDAEQLIRQYQRGGMALELADKAVESGIQAVWELMSAGRFKVFASAHDWLKEWRMYQRDEHGRIVKKNDHLMDACVVGSTEVATVDGPVAIRDLVGRDGRVVSRDGAVCRFSGARKTRQDVPVVRVVFEDGSAVTCTPDHPFLTPAGWRRADRMAGRDCYNGLAQRALWHPSTWWSSLRRVKSSVAVATTAAVTTISETASAFIARYGWPITVQCLEAGTSTTSMATAHTTGSRTWPAGPQQSTWLTTTAARRNRPLWQLLRRRVAGTQAQRVASGTARTTPGQAPVSTPAATSYARTVASPTKGKLPARTATAPTPASPRHVARLAWTIRNALAWCAARASWRIATAVCGPAAARAVVRCVAVHAAGRADVYCLTVPATSSFCLAANGAVVHNTRYAVYSALARAKPRPAMTVRRGGFPGQGGPQAWMQ